MLWERPPYPASSATPQDPLHSIFLVPQDPNINQKSQNFPILCSKCLISANVQFLILKICQNPVQEASILDQKSVLKAIFCQKKVSSTSPQIWCRSVLQAPIFWLLGLLIPTQTKVEYQYPQGWQVHQNYLSMFSCNEFKFDFTYTAYLKITSKFIVSQSSLDAMLEYLSQRFNTEVGMKKRRKSNSFPGQNFTLFFAAEHMVNAQEVNLNQFIDPTTFFRYVTHSYFMWHTFDSKKHLLVWLKCMGPSFAKVSSILLQFFFLRNRHKSFVRIYNNIIDINNSFYKIFVVIWTFGSKVTANFV